MGDVEKQGIRWLLQFCDTHGIRHETCGKVIVATATTEEVDG